jgi:sirohydrochlorin ferrochelatase
MAPGGTSAWAKTIKKTVKQADLPYPTRIFLGVGNSREEASELQGDVHYLEDKGANTIVVVPLLISSYSELYRQWKYLLGQGVQPGFISTPPFPLEHHADVQFAEPLSDDPILVEILLERLQDMSEAPAQEVVFIVAHGPNDESDNRQWLQSLQRLADRLKERGKFKSAEGLTLRDAAMPEVRSASIQTLRDRVTAADREGDRVLVVPLVLARGGIENKIDLALKGLDFAFNAKTLLPDHRISQWIRSKVP